MTATRQLIAQANAWSLEELELRVSRDTAKSKDTVFRIQGLSSLNMMKLSVNAGMRVMGGEWRTGQAVRLSEQVSDDVPEAVIRWVRGVAAVASGAAALTLPVYLYRDRRRLLFTVHLDAIDAEPVQFYQRSVALICNSALQ